MCSCKYPKKCLPYSECWWILLVATLPLYQCGFCVGNMSLWFLIFSPLSHRIITDDQTQVVESTLWSLQWLCVYIVLSFRLAQRGSSLSKALYWLMLGWPLCNFAQGLACVNSTVNINIWITVLCNSACFPGDAPGLPSNEKSNYANSFQSESSFVQTCTPCFCGRVRALQELGVHLVLCNMTAGQCFVWSSGVSVCGLSVTRLWFYVFT